MRRILLAVAMVSIGARAVGMEEGDRRLVERYLEILRDNPAHGQAVERLIGISSDDELRNLVATLKAGPLEDALIAARIEFASGRLEDAVAIYETLAATAPEDVRVLEGLAATRAKAGDPAGAIAAFEQILSIDGIPVDRKVATLVQLGEAFVGIGRADQALEVWDQAVALVPQDRELRRRVIRLIRQTGSEENTIPHLEWLAQQGHPEERLEALRELMVLEEERGNPEAAATFATAALDLLGADHWERDALERRIADLHARSGTLDSYVTELRSLLKDNPRDWRGWLMIASIEERRGNHAERIAALRQAHETVPREGRIIDELAQAEADFGDPAAAAGHLDVLLKTSPKNLDYHVRRAELDVAKGDLSGAETRLLGLVAAGPSDEAFRARIRDFFRAHSLADAENRLLLEDAKSGDANAILTLAENRLKRSDSAGAVEILGMLRDGEDRERLLLRAADLLVRHNALEEADSLLEQTDPAEAMRGELVQARVAIALKRGDFDGASERLEAALAVDPGLAEALDRQLFESIPTKTVPDRLDAVEVENALVETTESGSAPAWQFLRLARWRQWLGSLAAAEDALLRGHRQYPGSQEIVEALAELAVVRQDDAAADEWLETLAVLAPARRQEIDRRRASLQVRMDPDGSGLEALIQAVHDDPRSVDALMDLAAAKQRVDDWYGAMETWREAFALGSPVERSTMIAPILAVAERLRMSDWGLRVLVDFAKVRPDEAAATVAWLDAFDYAFATDELAAFEAEVERALNEKPEAFPVHVARARIFEANGEHDRAIAELENHLHLAADPVAALERILDTAARLGNPEAVTRAAMDLIRKTRGIDAWREAAKAMEKSGAPGTEAMWRAIRTKFSRDPEALAQAAEYFERHHLLDEHAEAVFAAAEIEPATPLRLVEAGRLAMQRGDRARAFDYFRRVIALTAETPSRDLMLPGSDERLDREDRVMAVAMRAVGGFVEPDSLEVMRTRMEPDKVTVPTGVAALRLEAIRSAARLATGGSTREAWLSWCRSEADPLDAAWGLYEAGEPQAAHQALLNALAGSAAPAFVERAIIWNAFRGGELASLREWVESVPELRRRRVELLFMVLSHILAARVELSPEQAQELFPSHAPAVEQWSAAWLLGTYGNLQSAVDLGRRAIRDVEAELKSQFAIQLANWELLLGEEERAISSLEEADEPLSGAMDDPALAALRMRWLLSSSEARDQLVAAELRKTIAPTDSGSSHGRRFLIAGLAGRDVLAELHAIALVEAWRRESGSGDGIRTFADTVRASVETLHSWDLPDLAGLVLAAIRPDDAALVVTQGDDATTWDMQIAMLSAVTSLIRASPREVATIAAGIPDRDRDHQFWAIMGRRLEELGFIAAATAVRKENLQRHPNDPAALREVLATSQTVLTEDERRDLLERLLNTETILANFRSRCDATEQLTQLLIRQGDPVAALPWIAKVRKLSPADVALVRLEDRALAAAGRDEDRRKLWREYSATDQLARAMGLAQVDIEAGVPEAAWKRLDAAMAREGKPMQKDAVALLLEAKLAAGEGASAVGDLQRLAGAGQWAEVVSYAPEVASAGELRPVIDILEKGCNSATQPNDRFACAESILKLIGTRMTIAEIREKVLLLRDAARVDSTLIPKMYSASANLAERSPEFRAYFLERMRDEWRDGAGSTQAGQQLLAAAKSDGDVDTVNRVLDQYLTNRHFDETDWARLAQRFTGDFARPGARVYMALRERFPQKFEYAFGAAKHLVDAGDPAEAWTLVEPWVVLLESDPAVRLLVADFMAYVSDRTLAANLLSDAVARDVAVRQPKLWTALARIWWEDGDFETAGQLLAAAHQNPTYWAPTELLDYLLARSNLEMVDPQKNEFLLPSERWTELRILVARALVRSGSAGRALDWISPDDLRHRAAQAVVTSIVGSDPSVRSRAAALWDLAIRELPESRNLKQAYDRFQLALSD